MYTSQSDSTTAKSHDPRGAQSYDAWSVSCGSATTATWTAPEPSSVPLRHVASRWRPSARPSARPTPARPTPSNAGHAHDPPAMENARRSRHSTRRSHAARSHAASVACVGSKRPTRCRHVANRKEEDASRRRAIRVEAGGSRAVPEARTDANGRLASGVEMGVQTTQSLI